MAKKQLPRVIIKSMWEHIQGGASNESMRDWFVSEGMTTENADTLVAKIKGASTEDALFELINSDREPPAQDGDLSDDELSAVAGGARRAAAKSKWPWESAAVDRGPSRRRKGKK